MTDGDSLVYILYTSGSTGQPKGVMVPHKGITRLVINTNYHNLNRDDRVLMTTPLSFDVSAMEIWGPLLNGAEVHLLSDDALYDIRRLPDEIARRGITVMWLTTGFFNQLAEAQPGMFATLKHLDVGGERVSPPHLAMVRRACPEVTIWNGYGPTENAVISTAYRVEGGFDRDIPIGPPINNTTAYVLDDRLRPVAIGVPGELCFGGAGVARGYRNKLELTASVFVDNPFRPGEKMYRSGDLGRWRADGVLEFLGRKDDQVKVRGYRIELDEVTRAVQAVPGVAQAVVLARDLGSGGKELVAYYAAEQGRRLDAEAVREAVAQALPGYFMPSAFVALERFPLNANGKVDRGKLPLPDPAAAVATEPEDPAEGLESALGALWREVLPCSRVGPQDNFFKLGGQSLKVMRLVAMVHDRLGTELPVSAVYRSPTLRGMAQYLENAKRLNLASRKHPCVLLNADRATRMFLFPPALGFSMAYARMSGLLPEAALYSFGAPDSAETLREDVDIMCRLHPGGPFFLLGHSAGGFLAFLAARELEARGREVAAIIVLDAFWRGLRVGDPSPEEVRIGVDGFLAREGREDVRAFFEQSEHFRERTYKQTLDYFRFLQAADRDTPVAAPVHLILAEENHDGVEDWSPRTRSACTTYKGSGIHRAMVDEPHLGRNVAIIRAILAAAGPAPATAVAARGEGDRAAGGAEAAREVVLGQV